MISLPIFTEYVKIGRKMTMEADLSQNREAVTEKNLIQFLMSIFWKHVFISMLYGEEKQLLKIRIQYKIGSE